jgi:hypothetical protein
MLPSQRLKEWWYYPLTVDVDKPNHQQEKKEIIVFLVVFQILFLKKKKYQNK